MLDINLIRKNPERVRNDLKKRKDEEKLKWIDEILSDDEDFRKIQTQIQQLRQKQNTISQDINKLKKQGKDFSAKIKELKDIPKKISESEKKQSKLKDKIEHHMLRLPNILHESVPFGASEEENVEVRKSGKIPKYDFELKSHVDICKELDLFDTDTAALIAGSRFYYLKNELVILDLALQRFALDKLMKKGFILMETPMMIKRKAIEGAVALSDFEDVIYKIEGEDLYMIGTAEHPLAAYHMGQTIDIKKLPLRYAGVSACFRKEAGSHGKDTKGIFRVHQFNKVEQFVFSSDEDSWKIHEELLKNVEEIFKELELPYRIVNICTGDIGTVAAKKYDLEVWMPVQKMYREMASCSNCTDYQARKLKIKYGKEGGEKKLVHTLNSTAIATSRAIVAIIENFQQKDGSIKIPKALHPYMNGIKVIKKDRI